LKEKALRKRERERESEREMGAVQVLTYVLIIRVMLSPLRRIRPEQHRWNISNHAHLGEREQKKKWGSEPT
jgi:hypothetical protein